MASIEAADSLAVGVWTSTTLPKRERIGELARFVLWHHARDGNEVGKSRLVPVRQTPPRHRLAHRSLQLLVVEAARFDEPKFNSLLHPTYQSIELSAKRFCTLVAEAARFARPLPHFLYSSKRAASTTLPRRRLAPIRNPY